MASKRTVYVRLDREEFRTLVNGGEVVTHNVSGDTTVRIILADIGFANMLIEIDRAITDAGRKEGQP
jgi:hypothetical protein